MNFDLHAHISLKVMLGGTDNTNRKDCWSEINSPVLDIVSGGVISSQSSLHQIQQGKVHIALAPMYSLEHAFSKNFLLSKFIPKIEKQLSKTLLQRIRDDKSTPFNLLQEELALIKQSENSKMKVIQKLTDYDPAKINIILVIEGMHNFQDSYLGKPSTLAASILKNLKSFITQHRVLYAGLAHLTRNLVATHCYGMKLIADKEFIPEGNGITETGKRVIDLCYSRSGFNNKYTLIDIKHMSLSARIEFYRYRDTQGYNHIPIVASHFACTGRSYNDIRIFKPKVSKKYDNAVEITYHKSYSDVVFKYSNSPQLEYVAFNPWTLNLFNEEIFKIIESDGIIGVIMDLRVLGAKGRNFGTTNPEGVEFLSTESFNLLKSENRFNILDDEQEDDSTEEEIEFDSIVAGKDAMHFFANILQIVKVYFDRFNSLKAWDHICVGSDSDGLIQPIEEYQNASDFDSLRMDLIDIFNAERKRDKFKKYFGTLPSDELVKKIFYLNGNRFINAYL
jgi:microsomal dipeptidase-like Zn-dependent dipeptidase